MAKIISDFAVSAYFFIDHWTLYGVTFFAAASVPGLVRIRPVQVRVFAVDGLAALHQAGAGELKGDNRLNHPSRVRRTERVQPIDRLCRCENARLGPQLETGQATAPGEIGEALAATWPGRPGMARWFFSEKGVYTPAGAIHKRQQPLVCIHEGFDNLTGEAWGDYEQPPLPHSTLGSETRVPSKGHA
ncbi:hypothetical protein [Marinobacterium aestuariivivens]|uniref:Uncharacterized protein n=1 Tax=Marinobacterium aestuariivivens TaxID=1698799 RepID=A0ABW2A2A9_9GAMM